MCDRSLGTDLSTCKTAVSIAGMSETHTPDLLRGISLESLRGFEVAARLLNYTRAAEELHVTQSAVSREIRALEDRIGTPLTQSGSIFLVPNPQRWTPALAWAGSAKSLKYNDFLLAFRTNNR